MVLVALGGVGRRDGQLSIDLVEGRLRGGEAELVLEEGRLGGISVRAGEIEALGRVDELLGLLHDVRQVGEHGFDQRRMTGGEVGGSGRHGRCKDGDAAWAWTMEEEGFGCCCSSGGGCEDSGGKQL